MRYTTPLWVRPTGFYNGDGDFCRTGSKEEPGVPLPNPGRVLPKHGHWRITPRGKMRMAPRKSHGGPMWPAQMPQPFQPDPNVPTMSVRMAVRAAVEAGYISREDAPSWAIR